MHDQPSFTPILLLVVRLSLGVSFLVFPFILPFLVSLLFVHNKDEAISNEELWARERLRHPESVTTMSRLWGFYIAYEESGAPLFSGGFSASFQVFSRMEFLNSDITESHVDTSSMSWVFAIYEPNFHRHISENSGDLEWQDYWT